MEFNKNKAIYLQIAELICEQILRKTWEVGGKIPSVRELAVQLEVNPNTVNRTYEMLQNQDIIFTKRGMGYFISENAPEKVRVFRREEFFQNDLPDFFKNLFLLQINMKEIQEKYEVFKLENI
jgi:GntR family transcriptional regulator